MGRRCTKGSSLDSKGKEKEVMPAYEYKCESCNIEYTKVRSITENDPGYDCESCNLPLVRIYSKVGAVFNGSGFYSTDNRKK
jgi:putative FmdB family regulatory protein